MRHAIGSTLSIVHLHPCMKTDPLQRSPLISGDPAHQRRANCTAISSSPSFTALANINVRSRHLPHCCFWAFGDCLNCTDCSDGSGHHSSTGSQTRFDIAADFDSIGRNRERTLELLQQPTNTYASMRQNSTDMYEHSNCFSNPSNSAWLLQQPSNIRLTCTM